MELPSTPSPNVGPSARRRKKRSTPTNAVPGSSLNGLNRNSIRVVELLRGSVGYGFTISGQKPCLLRCIVEGSPAERAGLRPGNCLVGVNGKDVSHLAHDDVVALIGTCTGLLRLHVADSYFSESSDDESFQTNHARPKYHHRPRAVSKTALSKKLPIQPSSSNTTKILESLPQETTSIQQFIRSSQMIKEVAPPSLSPSWDPLISSPRRNQLMPCSLGDESPIPAIPARAPKVINPNVEIVRVFSNIDNQSDTSSRSNFSGPSVPPIDYKRSVCDHFNTHSSSGSSSRTQDHETTKTCNPSPMSNSSIGHDISSSVYQSVVGYVGSVELPEIEEHKRLQALTACVRRLRMDRRMRSIVLLRIQSNGISLFSSSQNVQTEPPLAFYSTSIISFCGAYNDDRRFFGLVTCTSPNKNCSCHVFMVESKLLSHSEHLKRARAFGIQCNVLPVPKSGQVLGLQECAEFPATADPILNSILRLQKSEEPQTLRSPSEASTRLESTNSSNSDSGIGFREDSARNSARIYDIVEPELLFDIKNIRRSPVPRKKHPLSYKKGTLQTSPLSQIVCNHQHRVNRQLHLHDDLVRLRNGMQSKYSVNNPEQSESFESNPQALQEIIGEEIPVRDLEPSFSRRWSKMDYKSNATSSANHHHIEVDVQVTPVQRRQRISMERLTPISSEDMENGTSSVKSPLSRSGTRSLDNLCSPEVFSHNTVEMKSSLGSSTPALHQDSNEKKASDDFWEFKVPQPPKPKMEVNRVELWAESIEKLLIDSCGLAVFTEFLQHEFSAENILFYNACLRFKDAYPNITQSQRISMASTIFQRFLQNGASDPVNVDFQARSQVEKLLSQPVVEMFDLPLGQVFNLLKFDCYPRFLRSDMYRDYSTGANPLPQQSGDTSDSDQDSVKSQNLHQDGRRRSLLPWHIKSRSKKSSKTKGDEGLNSDISFIQRTASQQNGDSSDTDDGVRRQSYKLCRVTLPDNSTTVLPCKPGESLSTVVQRLLEKREFHYSAFEVISVSSGKPLDLAQEASEMTAREIKVESRAFIGIELPRGWRVGVRANPTRKISEVLKPILSQHAMKLDAVTVYDIETNDFVDVKWLMGRVDGHNLHVRLKDSRLEEITNHVQENCQYETAYMDDDETSNKTGSSQASNVFRGFLRRSSKKYKRKGKIQPNAGEHFGADSGTSVTGESTNSLNNDREQQSGPVAAIKSDDENRYPNYLSRLKTPAATTTATIINPGSPLSLVSTELSLTENCRNRKPIYIAQSQEKSES